MTTDAPQEASNDILYQEESYPPFLPVLVILPFLLPLFWHYRVCVDNTQVVFGYSTALTSKTLDRFTIVAAEPIEYINGLTQWGGWGIRIKLTGSETGYIARNGPGVRIKTSDRLYVFNCKDPQLVCEILMPKDDNDGGTVPLIS